MTHGSATDVTRRWFDQLEQVLHAEAELAGLLGHGTMIGNAREFFVTRVLHSVLPPSLHIGTGRILGHDGTQSKQIDVIVYDATFPVLETQPSQGLYLAEGVIAAIEVKSTVTKAKLREAMNNCLSVTNIPPSLMSREVTMQVPQMKASTVRDFPTFTPCSYVFGYQSRAKTLDTFSGYVNHWWEDRGLGVADICKIPEVIVAGKFLGLSCGRWFRVGVEGDLAAKVKASSGENASLVMGFWEVQHPFGWLLMHLLLTAAQRFSDSRKLVLNKYLPVMEYWTDEMAGNLSAVISEDGSAGGSAES